MVGITRCYFNSEIRTIFLPPTDEVWGKVIFSQGGLCQGGLCPGVLHPGGLSVQGGLCPGGSLSRVSLSWGFSVKGGLCPEGGLYSRGSLSRGVSVREIPSVR